MLFFCFSLMRYTAFPWVSPQNPATPFNRSIYCGITGVSLSLSLTQWFPAWGSGPLTKMKSHKMTNGINKENIWGLHKRMIRQPNHFLFIYFYETLDMFTSMTSQTGLASQLNWLQPPLKSAIREGKISLWFIYIHIKLENNWKLALFEDFTS